MNPLIQSKNKTILPVLITLTLACFALSPQARAVCQQGCDLANNNTFLGDNALINNTNGIFNTATGHNALLNNTTGLENTATGSSALVGNRGGNYNTGTGVQALYSNHGGSGNTATGYQALFNDRGFDFNGLQFGYQNTATGVQALYNNTTGNYNIAIGSSAGSNLTTGSNNIDIGALGVAGESNTIRIGRGGIQTKAFMQGIHGATVASGATVIVGSDGHLGTINSSARFKDEIKPMDTASKAILALKPVTFRYMKELDPESIPQFGLVAEEVAKVNPALVARDSKGEVYTVRYEAVNAMLLNEFLKEHRRVQELEANAARQQKQIEALTAGLQKVSAQLELRKAAPQTVLNSR
jgi:hypothetical protein